MTIHVIRPSSPLPYGRFTREREKLQFCIDAGYRQGLDFIQNDAATFLGVPMI